MLVFENIKSLQLHLSSISIGKQIGFVPTMGALHQGHLSLIENSSKGNDLTVVSIFVNPTQFNNQDDLVKYPRHLSQDLDLLKTVKCDIVFIPTADDLYNNDVKSERFDFDGLENQMEGKSRDGHFDGVGTVVKRLFEIVNPTNAYFGEKDFQQLQIIRKLVSKLQMKLNIHGCDIFREQNGLAMSSRNARLNDLQTKEAPFIFKTLSKAKELFLTKTTLEITQWVSNEFEKNEELSLEYFQIADEETLVTKNTKDKNKQFRAFIAVNAGEIRLIDNIRL
jgi:pantoate--beta-alanine ligase